MIEIVVWRMDDDVGIELGRIALREREDGSLGAVADEAGPPPRLLVYRLRHPRNDV